MLRYEKTDKKGIKSKFLFVVLNRLHTTINMIEKLREKLYKKNVIISELFNGVVILRDFSCCFACLWLLYQLLRKLSCGRR